MKILFFGLILLFEQNIFAQKYFDQNILAQKYIPSNIKNESALHFESTDAPPQITDEIGATYCFGILDTCLDRLLEIGISKFRLQKGVQCAAGDFDGNGYLDFAIWGIDTTKKHKYNIQWTDTENYLVLFFEKSKIIRNIKIKTTKGFKLVYYPQRLEKGPNGEPISKNDALWIYGKTDDYFNPSKGTVYVFDSETENFKTINFGKWKLMRPWSSKCYEL